MDYKDIAQKVYQDELFNLNCLDILILRQVDTQQYNEIQLVEICDAVRLEITSIQSN
jgi:hypothetical protein